MRNERNGAKMSETRITAQDGASYTFGERTKVKKLSTVESDGSLKTKFVFRNGVVREHVTPSDSPLYARLALHGADQKFGDAMAGLEDVEDCIEAFDAIAAQLAKGEWSERRVGDGFAGASLLARALVEVTGKSLDEVREKLANTSKEVKQALSMQPKVQAVILRLKAERSKGKVDADAALEQFVM